MSMTGRFGSLVAALALAGCAQGMDEDQGGGPDAAGRPDAGGFADAGPRPDAEVRPDAAPTPDSTPVANACEKLEAPVTTLSTYPAQFEGTVSGATAWLQVTEGSCTEEDAPYGVSATGPEQVIELSNLVEGTPYAVRVDADYDAAFYVVTGCSGGTDFAAGECLYYTDAQISEDEVGLFTATAAGTAYVIVDYYSASNPTTGTYRLTVIADPQCDDDWDCTGDAPVCDPLTLACAAGYDQCVGDDAADSADDGPGGATTMALVPDLPSAVSGAICGAPAEEADWFRFTAAAGDDVNITLSFTGDDELDLYVYDASAVEVSSLYAYTSPELLQLVDLAAGDYFIKLLRFGNASTAVTDYTLTVGLPECTWSGECGTDEPVCTGDQLCTTAMDACAGEGSGDDGDDGASVAKALSMPASGPATVNASICSAPVGNSIWFGEGYALESDWYKLDLAAGETVTATMSWTESPASEDLDIYLLGPDGTELDYSWTANPETVTATAATAGTYYLAVHDYGPEGVAAVVPYMLQVTKTAP